MRSGDPGDLVIIADLPGLGKTVEPPKKPSEGEGRHKWEEQSKDEACRETVDESWR